MVERPTSGPAYATTRADIARLHDFEHWPARWMWPMVFATVALAAADDFDVIDVAELRQFAL
jgi:hypothetical protein